MNKNKKELKASHVREILTSMLVVFVILKLVPGTEIYNWSWWVVMSPVWAPIAFTLALALISVVYYLIVKHDWTENGK